MEIKFRTAWVQKQIPICPICKADLEKQEMVYMPIANFTGKSRYCCKRCSFEVVM